eukprot:GGOE01020226.1.p1 GENE.GGOE01020226.1~~GGOE01020226.1.p1  ORF type:complete len:666 (+),score=198.18 GGOE01020226.1:26-2023(+)
MPIHIEGSFFKDDEGRTVQFRGINVGGNSKMPTRPCGYTWRYDNLESFFCHRDVSFVGRPFPLDEADEHFERLKKWGYTLLRFIITWEAIEHSGPGIYDTEYLDYLVQIVTKAGDHGLYIWVDPHQDVWSRFTGGSGAPGWTLEAVGFDMMNFKDSGTAIVHQTHGDPFTHMVWPTNYTKLACSTMFMLFFAGKTLAPNCKVEGESIQDYLQRHYINAMMEVVSRLKDIPCVIGYGLMNEPNTGWIGIEDLNSYKWELQLGHCCTPLQSMALGAGIPTKVETFDHGPLGFKNLGKQLVNAAGIRAWRDGAPCVWEDNGVISYKDGKAELLRPLHFSEVDGKKVDFYRDFLVPFGKQFAASVHQLHPSAFIFLEDAPFAPKENRPHLVWPKDPDVEEHIVCADHWYDGIPLMTKSYNPWLAWDGDRIQIGPGRAQRGRERGIREIQRKAAENMAGVPVIVGETGMPFDLDGAKAYRTGNFRVQERCMDGTMKALETCMASVTLWNYSADNTNRRGDNWNGEDLSLFSRDQMVGKGGLNDGGRALAAAVRPYARRFGGIPLLQSFDMESKVFRFRFRSDGKPLAPNEFFIPNLQYPNGYEFEVSDGRVTADAFRQILSWEHATDVEEHEIRIWDPRFRGGPSFLQIFLLLIPAALVVHFVWAHYWHA